MTKPVVIDSSALVAALKLDDANHDEAVKLMDALVAESAQLLLPLEVLAETLNIFGKKQGKVKAVAGGKALVERIQAGELTFAKSKFSTIMRALDLQFTATGNQSFIDCLVMAHAIEHQTEYVFGFDATFGKNGYILPNSRN